MDRFERQTIYEIFRACRLCGAGGGYKMPIIQNVVDLDGDIELRQKILECVQIEVQQDDKMPPLICELCVDKVNDFYEFLEMCRQTNKRTRLRLGLPPQTLTRVPDAGDCILGITEPVYVKNEDDEPLSKQKTKINKDKPIKLKKELKDLDVKIKIEDELPINRESRSSKSSKSKKAASPPPTRTKRAPSPPKKGKREPTPPRTTRSRASINEDDAALNKMKQKEKRSTKISPKSILKKEKHEKEAEKPPSSLTPRPLKRVRENEPKEPKLPINNSVSVKKVKIAAIPTPSCRICNIKFKTIQGQASHSKVHSVTFTDPKLACNACGVWFSSAEETSSHHRYHKNKNMPYRCRHCCANFKLQQAYDDHFEKKPCVPWVEVPDVKCSECWKYFPTKNLLNQHKCLGQDYRPGGKCNTCKRSYAYLKSLRKHQSQCPYKKKSEVVVDPEVQNRLKPMQVRISRCDSLLKDTIKQEHYDVSSVTPNFGLDKSYVYPYISSVRSLRIKTEPPEYDAMVNVEDEIKEEFGVREDYIHWDSDHSSDSEENAEESRLVRNPFTSKRKKVCSLASLSLRTIFSQRFLGKVPKKRRKVKTEQNIFDSVLNTSDIGGPIRQDIDNIIANLGSDLINNADRNVESEKTDSLDTWLFNNRKPNEDTKSTFDSLFRHQDKIKENDDLNSIGISNEDNRLSDDTTVSDIDDLGTNTHYNKNGDSRNERTGTIRSVLSNCETVEGGDLNQSRNKEDTCKNGNENNVNNVQEKDGGILLRNLEDNEADTHSVNSDDASILANYVFTNINRNPDVDNVNDKVERKEIELEKKEIKDDTENAKPSQAGTENDENSFENKQTSQTDSIHNGFSNSFEINETNNTDVEFESSKLERDEDRIPVSDNRNFNNDLNIDSNENINSDVVENNYSNILYNNVKLDDTIDSNAVNPSRGINEDINGDCKNGNSASNEGDNIKFSLEDLEDISDVEMDDKKLMEALDEQIGEINDANSQFNASIDVKETSTESPPEKMTLEDLIPRENLEIKSMDLDDISDNEFDLNA